MRIRDPIHNFVELPDDLGPLVDTRVLQRLRGIRQLALANLVYPGALHTRFDHTLGVTHVARLMANKLRVEGEELRLVTLTGLLHDTGHGPFSHVSETSLDWFGDRTVLQGDQKQHKIHEAVTAEIIRTDPELNRLITGVERDAVIVLLTKGHGRPVLRQIISGPLDADKQDYLLRDSHFCGVQYGRFDLAQLHRSLFLPSPIDDLMIDEDGVHAVEQFVLAKYYMTANVYRHRVRRITDQMIGRAIRLGIEVDRLEEMRKLYQFDGSPEFIANYLRWDDARFFETFCPVVDPTPGLKSGAMLRRFRERKLLKEVFHDSLSQYDPRMRETLRGINKRDALILAKIVENRVAEFLNSKLELVGERAIDPDFIIAYSYSIKSARESARNDEESILVRAKRSLKSPQTFDEASTLFRSIDAAYSDNFISIFAPVEWANISEKDKTRASWAEPIRELINTEWKKSLKS